MTQIVVIPLSELETLLERNAKRIVEMLASQDGTRWRREDMAKHHRVSVRTIDRWVKIGRIPGPDHDGCWDKATVLRRERERENT